MKYFIDDRLDETDLDAALRLMPQWRWERTLAYRREGLRRQSAGAWLLLRRACREVWGLDDVPEVSQGEHGKPYFADYPDLHFNLSHCTKGAACVVSDRPVGIDIETLQAPHEQLSRHVLSAAEYEAYAAQQAADPTFVIPAGKPVQANDSGSVFSDLMMLGPCTLHQYVEPEPTPGEGYYDENGNWVPAGETDPTDPEGSEEVSPEQGTDFLNWLLNTAA